MGYRKVPTIYTLALEDDFEGFVVRIKSLKIGKLRRLVQLMDEDDDKTIEFLDEMLQLLSANIVSWNLTDDLDQPIDPTHDEVADLEFPHLMAILQAWMDKLTGPDKELGKGSPSGGQFPGQPVTMEAL